MNAHRQPVDWLIDAREYAREARRIATDAEGEDFNDRDYLAIRYCLTVVGEALDQVPDDALALEPTFPWRQVIALRHRLVHAYWLIDRSIILEIASNEIDPLDAALSHLVDRF